jgi:homoserine O-acetyltransferase
MMSHAYYNFENHGPYELIDIGDLPLASGQTLHQCRLAVATFGQLNDTKDNAVLIPTWYSGTSKIIHDVFVGAGRPIDPSKYNSAMAFRVRHTIHLHHSHRGGFRASPLLMTSLPSIAWSRRTSGLTS